MSWLIALMLALGYSPIQVEVATILYEEGRISEFWCVDAIYQAESSWRPDAIGDVTIGGSYGLPQRHAPAHGKPEWPWPLEDQVQWTLDYADERYGDVCAGLEFRKEHGWW